MGNWADKPFLHGITAADSGMTCFFTEGKTCKVVPNFSMTVTVP
jgi:hypothetical protein